MTAASPIYVSSELLVQLHDRVIGRLGGRPGIRDHAALESSLAQPAMNVFGRERFESLHDKAGAYCFFVAQNQPFFDGNKRAGFLAAIAFLIQNGVIPQFDNDEIYELLMSTANDDVDVDQFLVQFRRADKSLPS